MPNYLDDFVCDVQCEDYYDDCWADDEDWNQNVMESIDIYLWGNS